MDSEETLEKSQSRVQESCTLFCSHRRSNICSKGLLWCWKFCSWSWYWWTEIYGQNRVFTCILLERKSWEIFQNYVESFRLNNWILKTSSKNRPWVLRPRARQRLWISSDWDLAGSFGSNSSPRGRPHASSELASLFGALWQNCSRHLQANKGKLPDERHLWVKLSGGAQRCAHKLARSHKVQQASLQGGRCCFWQKSRLHLQSPQRRWGVFRVIFRLPAQ